MLETRPGTSALTDTVSSGCRDPVTEIDLSIFLVSTTALRISSGSGSLVLAASAVFSFFEHPASISPANKRIRERARHSESSLLMPVKKISTIASTISLGGSVKGAHPNIKPACA